MKPLHRQLNWKWVVGLAVLAGATGLIYAGAKHKAWQAAVDRLATYDTFPALQTGDRLTIVSPHLDDETIGLGGTITQARRQGLHVSVIFMTNGDDNPVGAELQFKTGYATPEQLIATGRSRQEEALKALKILGVEEQDIYFLGLPDRGLHVLHTDKYATKTYMAPGTLKDSSPYERTFQKGLPYSGNAVRLALIQAIEKTRPHYLFTTLEDDRHSDHSATAVFVKEVLPKLSSNPKTYYFLVHYGRYPLPKGGGPSDPLVPPVKLASRPWKVIALDSDAVHIKDRAIEEYTSQLRIPFSGKVIRSFVRSNELVSE